MSPFCPDEDRRSEMIELSEISSSRHKGQLETASEEPEGDPTGLLKWVGSKQRIAAEVVKRFPRTCQHYYEPFCGSAAVFYEYSRPGWTGPTDGAFLSDANHELIGFYRAIQRDPAAVLERAGWYAAKHSEAWHGEVRARFNSDREALQFPIGHPNRAAMFLYLNRGSYNGLWRVSKKTGFNTPWNKGRCHVPFWSTFRAASSALRRAVVEHSDFEPVIARAERGDVVYCDPPYCGTFANYSTLGFDEAAHARLASAIVSAAKRGAHVILSQSDCPATFKTYVRGEFFDAVDIRVEKIEVYHSVGGTNAKRKMKPELLITYTKE